MGVYDLSDDDPSLISTDHRDNLKAALVMSSTAIRKAERGEDYDLYAVLETLFAPVGEHTEVNWKKDLKTSLEKVRESP